LYDRYKKALVRGLFYLFIIIFYKLNYFRFVGLIIPPVDKVIKLGIMSISCDSKTDPGGYASGQENLEQFEISDHRHTDEFIGVIKEQGYEPVWKDWDQSLQ